MFDRLSIRTKLIAIVAAPLAVIIGLAGLGYTQRSEEASDTRADAVRLEAIQAAQTLQGALQLEALSSVAFLAGPDDGSTEQLEARQDAVDEAADGLGRAMTAVGDDPTVQAAGASAVRAADQVAKTLRPQVEKRLLDWTWVENLYRDALNSLPTVSDRLVASIGDSQLVDGARTVVALGDYTTSQARIGVILAGVAPSGSFPDVDTSSEATETTDEAEATESSGVNTRSTFDEAVDRAEVELAVVSSQAGSRVRASLRNRMVGGDLSYFAETVGRVRDLPAAEAVSIDPERWTAAVEATLEQLRTISGAEADGVLGAADDRVTAAERAAQLFLGGALAAVLAALILAISVATSIARPVLNLTRAANRVANEQLPKLVDALRDPSDDDVGALRPDIEDIDVRGGKELAQLSASVSQIQEVAVSVATEQATMLRKGIGDMFVNLARRNQGLLDRQLEFIDELEAQEEDPDQLEHLFKLDHMATRMRRNAESLLVLAGAEPGRRRGKPVPLTKVALAAVGEIEHFARVDLLDVDECEVVSSAAADLAHLLSELMENATQFSPPDSRVEVVGHGNNGGGYTISITDQGIGMSADQLADANALLTRPPLLGLTLARTLGFIVVGRLAARHGIAVRLVPSPAGGVTAIVSIPTSVLVPQIDTVDLSDTVAGGGFASGRAQDPAAGSDGLSPFSFYDSPADGDAEPGPFTHAPFEPIGFEATIDGGAAVAEPAAEPAPSGDPFAVPAPAPAHDPFDAPATLAEAVPTGVAFDDGLSTVQDAPEPLIGTAPASTSAVSEEVGVARTSPLFGPAPAPAPRPLTPAPDGAPAPAGAPPAGPSVDGSAPASPRLFGTSGSRPPATPPATGGTHLFRPPPAPGAPAPAEARSTTPPPPPVPPQLPPAEAYVPTGPSPAGPPPLPVRTPGPPPGDLLAAPSLPSRSPAAPSTPSADALPPLPSRTPAPTPATPIASTNGHGEPASNGNGNGNGADPAPDPEVTTSGLVKRVPRRAGGNRAVPGSDGPTRGPTTTSSRSPDEVRAMLSRFHSGKQAGKAPAASASDVPFDSRSLDPRSPEHKDT